MYFRSTWQITYRIDPLFLNLQINFLFFLETGSFLKKVNKVENKINNFKRPGVFLWPEKWHEFYFSFSNLNNLISFFIKLKRHSIRNWYSKQLMINSRLFCYSQYLFNFSSLKIWSKIKISLFFFIPSVYCTLKILENSRKINLVNSNIFMITVL